MVAVNDAQITLPPMPPVEQLFFCDSLAVSSYWFLLRDCIHNLNIVLYTYWYIRNSYIRWESFFFFSFFWGFAGKVKEEAVGVEAGWEELGYRICKNIVTQKEERGE